MAETDTHLNQMVDALLHPLKERFRDRPDVYVSGNLFLYYEEGNPAAVVAPDVFVVFGVPKRERRVYKLWEEENAPDVVFELTSRKTYRDDLSDKRLLYEELGVQEYFIFDPLHEYLQVPLQGFRLVDGYYFPLKPEMLSEGEWSLYSERLQLALHTAGSNLRLYDPFEERFLLMRSEEAEARWLAETRLKAEADARRLAEERAAEEKKARQIAEARANAAEAELARLRALLYEE